MRKSAHQFLVLAGLTALSGCAVQEPLPDQAHHTTLGCAVTDGDLESPGAQAHLQNPGANAWVILKGAFDKEGPFEAIASWPPGTKVRAHYHGGDEEAVVISGGLYMGDMTAAKNGEVMDTSIVQFHQKGDRHFVPAKVIHWLYTKDEPVVLKVCGEGPFTTYWVEPPK